MECSLTMTPLVPRSPGLYLEARLHAVLKRHDSMPEGGRPEARQGHSEDTLAGKSLGPLPEGTEKPLPSPLSPGPPPYVPMAGSGSHFLIICLGGRGEIGGGRIACLRECHHKEFSGIERSPRNFLVPFSGPRLTHAGQTDPNGDRTGDPGLATCGQALLSACWSNRMTLVSCPQAS